MIRPIAPGLSPNLEREDAFRALSLLVKPWQYSKGAATKQLEKWFEDVYGSFAFAFSSGRGALFAVLVSLGIGKGDEVLVEGFTCVAVVDAILATGAMPIYVDIKKDFTLDIPDAKKKLSSKTKAMILQHTFGIPGGGNDVVAFAKEHKIFLIEDVAHAVGVSQGNKLLGKNGIAAVFSFGRDKAFSSVSGGMAIANDKKLGKALETFQNAQPYPSIFMTFQNIFHMVSFYFLILPLYDGWHIGKLFLVLFQKIGLLAKPIDANELDHFSLYTEKLPNALAAIALFQVKRMKKFNAKRSEHARYYSEVLKKYFPNTLIASLPLLRYPLLVENPQQLKRMAKKQQVYLGDWYSHCIDPKGTDLEKIFYKKHSCPQAEEIAQHIINLPTYPTLSTKQAEKVATIVIAYVKNNTNHQ